MIYLSNECYSSIRNTSRSIETRFTFSFSSLFISKKTQINIFRWKRRISNINSCINWFYSSCSNRAVSTNNDDKTYYNDLSPVTKLFHRPYVRAMFAFIHTADGNDLQYECVLVRISYFLSLSFHSQLTFSQKTAFQ